MKKRMVNLLFDRFLRQEMKVTYSEREPESGEEGLFYVACFSEKIPDKVLKDIIEWREHEMDFRMERSIGITINEYAERYIYAEKEHPTLTAEDVDKEYQRLAEEVVPDMDEYALKQHGIKKEDLTEYVLFGIDLEDFVKQIGIEPVDPNDMYDAYGTTLYQVEDRQFVIYSTYDNGSDREHDVVMTLCCYDPEENLFELADILYDQEEEVFCLTEVQTGEVPHDLSLFNARDFAGKRSFNWKVDDKYVAFRCSNEVRHYLGSEDKFEEYNKNVSGNRLEIQLH